MKATENFVATGTILVTRDDISIPEISNSGVQEDNNAASKFLDFRLSCLLLVHSEVIFFLHFTLA